MKYPRGSCHGCPPGLPLLQFAARFSANRGCAALPVQHHFAHVLSCMAENEIEGPALGVAWDGTGYGLDGTIGR